MKSFKHNITRVFLATMVFAFTLGFSACTQKSPVQPDSMGETTLPVTLAKRPSGGGSSYPQVGVKSFALAKGDDGWYYNTKSGSIMLGNGSKFIVDKGALRWPTGGASLYVKMTADYDSLTNEIRFMFIPHGTQFNPPAEVWLSWSDLNVQNAQLYYIDANGDYLPQQPDDVDFQGKKMKVYIDHFSRYAIGVE